MPTKHDPDACEIDRKYPATHVRLCDRDPDYGPVRVCGSCVRAADRLLPRHFQHVPIRDASGPLPERRPVVEPTGYVGRGHPPTAQAMAGRALPSSGTLRSEIVEALAASEDGLTDYELEASLGRSHQSISGARRGLVKDGWVVGTTRTRTNQFGNEATVWRADPEYGWRRLNEGGAAR